MLINFKVLNGQLFAGMVASVRYMWVTSTVNVFLFADSLFNKYVNFGLFQKFNSERFAGAILIMVRHFPQQIFLIVSFGFGEVDILQIIVKI